MYTGNKSIFSNTKADISKTIKDNDLYNSAFIANMMHDRANIGLEEVIETDVRLDIFVERVCPNIDQSIIQIVNKLTDWSKIKAGDSLYVPTKEQLMKYSISNK